ncbi:MAG: response regulator [Deltaproteobacteria bacterium]|nr:response regulator [Deltaproteobacteria bacterium]
MKPATILLVEDNPITRKLVRFTLENQGLTVLDAPDARAALTLFPQHQIALVLQDLLLPDMDGFDLVARLRALPGGRDVPILVFSGMLSSHDEARVSAAGFDDLITKPVEPSRLVQIVRSYLPAMQEARADRLGAGRRLVIADDDPVQRKLVGFRMQRLGFEVVEAADGTEALAAARRVHPHAVVSDVLMPGLDGFALCLEIRKDPALAAIPVVLTTNSYVETTDRELARRAGAFDLVLRTPELREVLEALRASLASAPAAVVDAAAASVVEEEHVRRMMRQLERQVLLNARANQRCALLSAEMTVLTGISEALARDADIDEALRHTLAACFDAGGISLGALFLKGEDVLRVLSFGFSRDWSEGALATFFGERALLDDAMAARQSRLVASTSQSAAEQRLLAKARAESALIAPVAHRDTVFGALVMFSKNGELEHDDRVKFGEAVAGQISQALAVAHAFRAKQRSEQAAREQAAILHSVVESIGDGVGVIDDAGQVTLWNSAANEILKMKVQGGTLAEVAHSLGVFDADTVTPMAFERLPPMRALAGEAVDGVELFVRHDKAPAGIWLSASARPWRDEQGAARGAVSVFRDITREKATQAHLLVSDRMASVGMLAAGVAHEINNPLASVLANVELAQRELAESATTGAPLDVHELREMLADARGAADRVRQIVRDLKIFSRHEEVRAGAVDVHKVLESSLRMAWNEIRHRARLIKDLADVPLVEGSESRLGQVFLNLIVNAAQAIPEGNATANTIRVVTSTDPAGRIAVTISDTGTGIAPQDLNNLFRPFFTTKPPGVGTGLGLAICHRIVTGLGGEIQVESQVGKGTTFRVLLPAARTAAVTEPVAVPHATAAPRRARILVIDDEPMIGQAVRRILAKEHEVVVTTDARVALDRVRAREAFDVILCDLMMPQMTGMELHGELRKLDPALADRIVFLTGGAFTPAARAFLDEVPNQRVEKPFDAQHLRALVNDRIR